MVLNAFSKIRELLLPPPLHEAPAIKTSSSELLKKVRAIQIKTNHLVDDVMAGEYHTAFKGRGMEFSEVREYQPEDDVRLIDWNVSARMNQPYVKEFIEERELTVMLMVDASASGNFGSAQKRKNEIAAEAASILAFAAIKNNDKIGLIVFTDRIERFIPPKKGKAHVWNIIRSILDFDPEGKSTDLNLPLEYLAKVQKKKAATFLISDFQTQGYEKALKLAKQKHDLTAIYIRDPREKKMPDVGLIQLEDAESGEVMLADTGSTETRRIYQETCEQEYQSRLKTFRSMGVGVIEIDTERPLTVPIIRYFKMREKRR